MPKTRRPFRVCIFWARSPNKVHSAVYSSQSVRRVQRVCLCVFSFIHSHATIIFLLKVWSFSQFFFLSRFRFSSPSLRNFFFHLFFESARYTRLNVIAFFFSENQWLDWQMCSCLYFQSKTSEAQKIQPTKTNNFPKNFSRIFKPNVVRFYQRIRSTFSFRTDGFFLIFCFSVAFLRWLFFAPFLTLSFRFSSFAVLNKSLSVCLPMLKAENRGIAVRHYC